MAAVAVNGNYVAFWFFAGVALHGAVAVSGGWRARPLLRSLCAAFLAGGALALVAQLTGRGAALVACLCSPPGSQVATAFDGFRSCFDLLPAGWRLPPWSVVEAFSFVMAAVFCPSVLSLAGAADMAEERLGLVGRLYADIMPSRRALVKSLLAVEPVLARAAALLVPFAALLYTRRTPPDACAPGDLLAAVGVFGVLLVACCLKMLLRRGALGDTRAFCAAKLATDFLLFLLALFSGAAVSALVVAFLAMPLFAMIGASGGGRPRREIGASAWWGLYRPSRGRDEPEEEPRPVVETIYVLPPID
jgi:hypothetical protein